MASNAWLSASSGKPVRELRRDGQERRRREGAYRLSLVSFPVYFQCKRPKGAMTAGAVRDFRGAVAGRDEKGLLITIGSFTCDAQAEASRDGAPPVELMRGQAGLGE